MLMGHTLGTLSTEKDKVMESSSGIMDRNFKAIGKME